MVVDLSPLRATFITLLVVGLIRFAVAAQRSVRDDPEVAFKRACILLAVRAFALATLLALVDGMADDRPLAERVAGALP